MNRTLSQHCESMLRSRPQAVQFAANWGMTGHAQVGERSRACQLAADHWLRQRQIVPQVGAKRAFYDDMANCFVSQGLNLKAVHSVRYVYCVFCNRQQPDLRFACCV